MKLSPDLSITLNCCVERAARTTELWNTVKNTAESRVLEVFNELLDTYINALVSSNNLLAPQYICLLRQHLTQATLRRFLVKQTPGLEASEVAEGAADSLLLSDAAAARVCCPHLWETESMCL
jgi:hypothetical protein